jgi:alkanesulfonate monooxygenase SsuD/methylene tetrahydromethanopterin reductase-like flavin-dependent oxidoreductase (luciferase family)
MKYAIELWAAGVGDARTLAELAQLAEDSGWDGFFLEDYITHWYGKETYDPWVALAAMAMSTKYIRLGTAVTPLPRRRPWKLAREAVTLDHLSNGRLILGVGLGGVKDPLNFDRLGEVTDMKLRAGMADEALDILIGLWSGEPFSYNGKHYQVKEVTFLPKPVQQPRIPIWVGGGWPGKPIQRAARFDGFVPYKNTATPGQWQDIQPEEVRTIKAYIDGQRASSTPFDLAFGGRVRSADWELDRAHIRAMAQSGATWWTEFVEPPDVDLEVVRQCIRRGPLRVD